MGRRSTVKFSPAFLSKLDFPEPRRPKIIWWRRLHARLNVPCAGSMKYLTPSFVDLAASSTFVDNAVTSFEFKRLTSSLLPIFVRDYTRIFDRTTSLEHTGRGPPASRTARQAASNVNVDPGLRSAGMTSGHCAREGWRVSRSAVPPREAKPTARSSQGQHGSDTQRSDACRVASPADDRGG